MFGAVEYDIIVVLMAKMVFACGIFLAGIARILNEHHQQVCHTQSST